MHKRSRDDTQVVVYQQERVLNVQLTKPRLFSHWDFISNISIKDRIALLTANKIDFEETILTVERLPNIDSDDESTIDAWSVMFRELFEEYPGLRLVLEQGNKFDLENSNVGNLVYDSPTTKGFIIEKFCYKITQVLLKRNLHELFPNKKINLVLLPEIWHSLKFHKDLQIYKAIHEAILKMNLKFKCKSAKEVMYINWKLNVAALTDPRLKFILKLHESMQSTLLKIYEISVISNYQRLLINHVVNAYHDYLFDSKKPLPNCEEFIKKLEADACFPRKSKKVSAQVLHESLSDMLIVQFEYSEKRRMKSQIMRARKRAKLDKNEDNKSIVKVKSTNKVGSL